MNQLYFGDNLDVLRKRIKDESVDLVYLDPPFNSNSDYNVIYKSPMGAGVASQLKAFKDTWNWEEDAAHLAIEEISRSDSRLFHVLEALQRSLGEGDLMAYLAMMSVRLLELKRVLKPTGSLYLHCDTTASHYLKVILDHIFGSKRFQNDITWRRTSAHNDPNRYGRIQDRILFYSKGKTKTFNHIGGTYSDEQLARYKYEEGDRRYKGENLTAPHFSATRTVDWRGVHPGDDRQWRFGVEELDRLYDEGRILLRRDGKPRKDGLKEYLDESEAPVLQDLWTDIKRIGNTANERLGFPTQKPLALLERIIQVSSNPGDLILDPFCGCGTTIHAAQTLGRQWIGIDIAYAAILVIEDRLKTWLPTARYEVGGIPSGEDEARALARLDPYTFQQWAVGRLGGQPRGPGSDRGIDGEIIFLKGVRSYGRAIVSVKGGQTCGPAWVRELVGTVQRERADIGVFVCLNPPTKEMRLEAQRSGMVELPGGMRPRIQIASVADLVAGPNLGILTGLNTLQAAQEARAVRKTQVKRPTPEQLRREPPLPPMPLMGGRSGAAELPLPLGDAALAEPRPARRRRS